MRTLPTVNTDATFDFKLLALNMAPGVQSFQKDLVDGHSHLDWTSPNMAARHTTSPPT